MGDVEDSIVLESSVLYEGKLHWLPSNWVLSQNTRVPVLIAFSSTSSSYCTHCIGNRTKTINTSPYTVLCPKINRSFTHLFTLFQGFLKTFILLTGLYPHGGPRGPRPKICTMYNLSAEYAGMYSAMSFLLQNA